ncbi:hypothetical protein IJJ36_00510 [Candidatus Saccharibacteria bacterium]|nr:hypothetical protein [Candidatus Saccharibacteria bacterium]
MAKTLVYQLYPLAWNGLNEMTEHLARIKKLNVDYVWLGPLCMLPTFVDDEGVDGYKIIDRRFGTMQDFDNFVETAHKLGIKVLMEISIDPVYPYYIYEVNDWFDSSGRLNFGLLRKFRRIVKFWLHKHSIDGFSVRIARDVDKKEDKSLNSPNRLSYEQATDIVNLIFGNMSTRDGKNPFLITECYDDSYGLLVDYICCYAGVNFVMNSGLRNLVENGLGDFDAKFHLSTSSHNFMLNLESPNTQRFTTRSGLSPTTIAEWIFESDAKGICIYQGQEIGVENSTRSPLPLEKYNEQGLFGLYCFETKRWKNR